MPPRPPDHVPAGRRLVRSSSLVDLLLWTDADMAQALRLSARGVDRLRMSGVLPCVIVEGHRRYRPADVRAFVDDLTAPRRVRFQQAWTLGPAQYSGGASIDFAAIGLIFIHS